MLVHVKETELEKVNEYIKQFNVKIVDGRMHYIVKDSGRYPEQIDDIPAGKNKLQRMALEMVKAKFKTSFKNIAVGIYVGNVDKRIKPEFIANDFVVNEHSVVIISDAVYEVHSHLIFLRDTKVLSQRSTELLSRIIDNWPTVPVIEEATAEDISLEFQLCPKFDYHKEALIYQTILPLPLSKIKTANAGGAVHIVITDNAEVEDKPCYRFTVSIADFPPFGTDTLPTPNNIRELIIDQGTILRRIKTFLKGLIC